MHTVSLSKKDNSCFSIGLISLCLIIYALMFCTYPYDVLYICYSAVYTSWNIYTNSNFGVVFVLHDGHTLLQNGDHDETG